MALRRLLGSGAPALLGICLLFGTACVEPFGGSNVQFTLAGSVHVPGLPAEFGRPPPGTHYEYYAVDIDSEGNEFALQFASFDVRPVIETGSPCFIEDDEARFPGLHSTMIVDKLAEEFGVNRADFDPGNPPSTMDEGDVIDFLTAEVRENNYGRLQAAIKAVTSHSPAQYPAVAADCSGGANEIPPPNCIDDASNERRRQICNDFWDQHPDRYEGSDKVFTLPLNGRWFGAVDGADPRNAQFLGGAGFFVDANLENIEALLLNWQYNCTAADYNANGLDCEPVYPDAFPEADKSPIGYHYMSGFAVEKTRGVLNVPMENRLFGRISGEAAIWYDLDSDDVTF